MHGIRAFIGHSFSEEDEPIVRIFLDHFENLAKAYPEFTWDHAEEAEPSPLSKKVLAKIQDKNVFIGICTKKERAIVQKALSPTLFKKSIMKANEADFKWKTSDWIIQEIGLAVGRNMSVILFLEDDVRDPGGLHGDIEYIRFSRATPHQCFDKLLQMLVSLTPKGAIAGPPAEAKSATSEERDEPETVESDLEPKPDWTNEQYESAAASMIFDDDEPGLEKISIAFKDSIYAQGDGLAVWDARIEYLRLLFGKKADFEKIKTLASKNPKSSRIAYFVASGYKQFKEYESAATKFEEAYSTAQNLEAKVRYITGAAIAHAEAGAFNLAYLAIEKAKAELSANPELQEKLLSPLRRVAEIEKNKGLELAILEQMVEFHPGDTGARFSLAYQHSENQNGDLALYHYLRIPTGQRDGTAWNNLGVSYGEFGMPAKGVSAFLQSEQRNETLAMSNLGFKLLNAGFIEAAREKCEKALSIDGYDKNIPILLENLTDIPEKESKKLEEILEKVKTKASYYRKLGEAALRPWPTDIAGKWKSNDGVLEASRKDTSIRLFGEFPHAIDGLAAALGMGVGILQPTYTQKVEYVGVLRGQMIGGHVSRSRAGDRPTLLDSGNVDVLMYFSEDGSELHVMENHQSVSPTFYTLMRAA